jgi:predicted CXXCH cytochrome family protein
MRQWRFSAFFALAAVGIIGLALSSCSTVSRTVLAPPEIEGANFVGNKTCADCHTNITRIFHASPHGRFYKDDVKWAGMTGCESCHGAGSKHVAAGGGRGKFIVNPGKDPASCFQCHLEVHAQLNLPHHHPVVENRMNCTACHDPHGHDIKKPAGGLAMARLNESCAECHREQARPFAFEHEALRDGCTVCHSPHGSINAKLLTERDNNLCLKCHAQVQATAGQIIIGKLDHSSYMRRGTCWSAGCHTAIHGSNISPRMLY